MKASNAASPQPDLQGLALFPREISRFFTGGPGQTLLVNGAPGTGKTLFTIRGLDVLERDGDVLYVTTRVDQATVHEMYFAEHSTLEKTHILDLSQDPFDLPLDIDVPFEKVDLDSLLEWIQQIKAASTQLTIAFDSWELVYAYLAARHDEPPEFDTLTNQLVALARQEDIRLLLVSETAESSALEYIVDGVVTLQVTEDDRGRTRRHLRLEKLRGVRIGNRLQPITLAGGQFQTLTPIELSAITTGEGTWQPRDASKATFSTGIRDLDHILSGGYNRGSVVHLELGTDLSRDAWSVLTLPTIRNFLASEMGVAVVPPREASPGLLHNDLNKVLSPGIFDRYCHVFETYIGPSRIRNEVERTAVQSEAGPEEPQRVRPPTSTEAAMTDTEDASEEMQPPNDGETSEQSAGIDDELELPVQEGQLDYESYITYVDQAREQSAGPLLHVISMDTARPALESRLGDFANYVALHNDLTVHITKPGGDLRSRADRVADMHFRLERSGEALVLYGENPLTPLHGIGLDHSRSIPELTLTEMV